MGKTLQELEEIANKALTEYFGRKEPPVVLAYVCGSRTVKTYIDIRQRPYILKITEDVLVKNVDYKSQILMAKLLIMDEESNYGKDFY